jgi:hypothetical protein
MSMRLKRLVIGLVAALPTVFLIPGQASASVCVNAVNASVGAGSQTNNCTTDLTLTP